MLSSSNSAAATLLTAALDRELRHRAPPAAEANERLCRCCWEIRWPAGFGVKKKKREFLEKIFFSSYLRVRACIFCTNFTRFLTARWPSTTAWRRECERAFRFVAVPAAVSLPPKTSCCRTAADCCHAHRHDLGEFVIVLTRMYVCSVDGLHFTLWSEEQQQSRMIVSRSRDRTARLSVPQNQVGGNPRNSNVREA